jgi:hypothetical protein
VLKTIRAKSLQNKNKKGSSTLALGRNATTLEKQREGRRLRYIKICCPILCVEGRKMFKKTVDGTACSSQDSNRILPE